MVGGWWLVVSGAHSRNSQIFIDLEVFWTTKLGSLWQPVAPCGGLWHGSPPPYRRIAQSCWGPPDLDDLISRSSSLEAWRHAWADNNDENEDEDQIAIRKLLSVLQQREDFPVQQRNKIIELTHEFVNNLGTDIKDMVTDQRTVADGYAGLDSNRDTPKEVETALRHYPETLSERGGQYN